MKTLIYLMPTIFLLVSCSSSIATEQAREDQRPEVAEPVEKTVNLPKVRMTPELMYQVLLADIAHKRGHIDVAKREYGRLAHKTRDPRLVERAARVAFLARDNEAALKSARLLVDIDPDNLEARKLLALLLIKTHQTKQALIHLEKLVTEYWSNNLQGFILIARLLSNEKDSKVAFGIMEQLVARHPDVPEAQFALAELAMRAEKLEKSQKAIDRVLVLKPNWPEAMIFRTRVLQARGKVQEALAYLKKVVNQNKDSLHLRLTYARVLLEAKRYNEARGQFKVLAEQAPENDDILYALGGLSLEVKQYQDAELYLKKLIDMDKKTLVASYYLGQVKEQQKQYKQAIEWYSKVERGEHYLSAQIRIGMIIAKNDVKKAQEHLKTIHVNGKEQKIRVIIANGEIFREAKQYKKEVEVYSESLRTYKDNTSLLYARALAAEKADDLPMVESDLKKILTKEPNNAAALNALGYTLADRTTRYRDAEAYIKRALELKPDDPAILDSMGWVQYRLGNYKKAETNLRKAMKESDDPEIAAHLGEVLWVAGDQDGARQVWKKARMASPDNEVLQHTLQKYNQL